MQRFIAQLSSSVDKSEFEQAWQNDPTLTGRPKVEFAFAGRMVSALVHTDSPGEWSSTRFHESFSTAIRRLNRDCNVRWL